MNGITRTDRSSPILQSYPATRLHTWGGRKFAPATYGEGYRYCLPVDEEELTRQELTHRAWAAVGKIIAVDVGLIPAGTILDLGTGWALWVSEVAMIFANQEIVGVDLYVDASEVILNNATFVVKNYEEKFGVEDGQVALINLRDAELSLRNPEQLARNIFIDLCPGAGSRTMKCV
ncbi:hypothetical protein CLCR_10897 [Cladophialophora carrionii]|uniref:Methyltransferase domain-containing protein n=1 Tax=Cladophialophora carrionii TaxID=86049 RepID=A0A1C1CW04_9EURO|nr:hypothetical protein CLCR_10897 [Cladophialophora carrionii]